MAGGGEFDCVYVVDASAWIFIEGHPAQNRILYCLTQLIEAGRVICPPESWDEVKKCPWVIAWLGALRGQIVESPSSVEYLLMVGRVTHAFPSMAGARQRKERADQYVVGLAAYLSEASSPKRLHEVVASESDRRRPNRKIPTACEHFGVACRTLLEVLEREFPDEEW